MKRTHFDQRLAELNKTYEEFKPIWIELADYFLSRQTRFLTTDTNKKPKFSSKIVDSSTGLAVRNFAAGMMSGATDPSRKWFKIGLEKFKGEDPSHGEKDWTATVGRLFADIFYASGIYQEFPSIFAQLGIFGISALCVKKDPETIMHCKTLPMGSYRIARNSKGKIDTLYRIYQETAKNLVEKFGKENCSNAVITAYDNNNHNSSFEVVHAVEPNEHYKPDSPWAKNKKYVSVYYENGTNEGKILSKSGFDYFPYIVFITEVNGEDVYPVTSPGILALPDAKQVMKMIKEDAKAVQKMVSPPTQGPSSLKNKQKSTNPGAFNPVMDNAGNGLKAIYELNPALLTPLETRILRKIEDIEKLFYNDLFAMILQTAQRVRTATEVAELKEEKMVLTSPLLEQIHTSMRDLFDWVFDVCVELGILPPPPPEIQGKQVKIEFVSIFAQAMQASDIAAIERFLTFISNLMVTIDPFIKYKIRLEEIVDAYGDKININPDFIVPNEEYKATVQSIQQQQAQQQAMQNLQQGSEIIKNMGGADASGGNLMERIGLA